MQSTTRSVVALLAAGAALIFIVSIVVGMI
jgi:hypothetical protein